MTIQPQLADVLGDFVSRSGYTPGQLSKLSGIPKPTIVNWLEGRVRKPRGVEDLLDLGVALHLSETEMTELLICAGHPAIATLQLTAVNKNNRALLNRLSQFQHLPLPTKAPPFQAFADLPTFIGRESEIASIQTFLTSDRTPKFISIQGMGGVGKTALAIHLAHMLRSQFPDGVLWAKVSQSDSHAILYAFASAFNVDITHLGDIEIRSQMVRNLMANKALLLILDDVKSSQQLTPLLPPSLKGAVIWTTRRQDLAKSRYAFQVKLAPFDVEAEESLALFALVLGQQRMMTERPYLQNISQLLGHLPLAIDIAAARLAFEPGWTAKEFLQQIEKEKSRLTALRYENQDIQPLFEASYDMLSDDLKAQFIELAIFENHDFSDTAVAAILELNIYEARQNLRKLFSLSLIRSGRKSEAPRFQLHALIFSYLKGLNPESGISHNYTDYYLNVLLENPNDMAVINMDYFHIQKSLKFVDAVGVEEQTLQFINSLFSYWEATGELETANEWLEKGYQIVLAEKNKNHIHLLLIFNLAQLHERFGNFIEAETHYEEALRLARKLNDSTQLSQILRRLGVIASRRSDYVLAEAYYKEGIQLSRIVNGGNAVSLFLRGLGIQAYMKGELAKAEAFYEEGLALLDMSDEKVHQTQGQISRIWGLGSLAMEQGQLQEAKDYFETALKMSFDLGHRKRAIVLLRSLAQLHFENRDLPLAIEYSRQALSLAREVGGRWQQARISGELGNLLQTAGDFIESETYFREQFNLGRILNSQEIVAISLFGLAKVAKHTENLEMANHYGNQSLDSFTAIGHRTVQTVSQWLVDLSQETE